MLVTATMVPRVTSIAPLAWIGGIGIVIAAASGGGDDALVGRVRVVVALAVAASMALLDDTAAVTLAPSPTSLLRRRAARVALIAVILGAWWSIVMSVVVVRVAHGPLPGLAREVVVLALVGVVASLVAQRWSDDGRGAAAGGLTALGWYVLSLVPPVGSVPWPPNPMDPDTAARIGLLAVVLGLAAVALSQDPAISRRRNRSRRGTP